jgi:predicted RNA methylase
MIRGSLQNSLHGPGAVVSTASRLGRNAAIDLRFGRPLAATYLRNKRQSNSDYRTLEAIFAGRVNDGDVLVDVGCGAGRVINQWLRLGVASSIYGLESDERLAAATRRRLRRRDNVRIVVGDAIENLPTDGTVFFMFNPFDRPTMDRFAEAILNVASAQGREVAVIYHNAKHVGAFEGNPRFDVVEADRSSAAPNDSQSLAIIRVKPHPASNLTHASHAGCG